MSQSKIRLARVRASGGAGQHLERVKKAVRRLTTQRRSEPPLRDLTPYQARLDVEMDDTAVSRVRDPSASIRLGPDGALERLVAPIAARSRPHPLLSAALGGSCGILLVVIVVWIGRSLHSEAVVAGASSASVSSLASAGRAHARPVARQSAAADSCAVAARPKRIASRAARSVAPSLFALPGAQRVAIGYSRGSGYASGLLVDPDSLESEAVFREWRPGPLGRVVPAAKGGEYSFATDRGQSALRSAFVVGGASPFLLGVGKRGIALRDSVGTRSVWETADTRIGSIVVTSGEAGHLVVLRRESGASFGWLDGDGTPITPLAELGTELTDHRAQFGVGAGAAIAVRVSLLSDAPDSEGEILVTRLPRTEAPSTARVQVDGHGILASRIVAVAFVAPDRWLIAYQVAGPNPHVFAVTIDEKNSAVAKPVTMLAGSSTAGAAIALGDRALVAVTMQSSGGGELFVIKLDC